MTNRYSVLIVDDDRANIIALTHILNREYMIYSASNGKDAIESAREHVPDVILMDVFMPEMSGFQALALLKDDEKTQSIPVIIITGLESPMNRDRGISLGAADYITKPFEGQEVKNIVHKHIEKKLMASCL